jgi:enediyne biosynthesis protein E3
MRRIVRTLLSLSGDKARFARSLADFEDPGLRRRLKAVGDAFLDGYRASLEEEDPEALAARVARIDPELWGFAHEGVGLGLCLLDSLPPWRRRFDAFLEGPGAGQPYMLHVGAGWVLARLPVSPSRFLGRFDPLLRWMALDGFGFHEAFFHWRRTVERRRLPAWLPAHGRGEFDVGVGRHLWFSPEVEAGRLAERIASFPADRQGDLWTGVGEACVFSGLRGPEAIAGALRAAGRFAPQLGQGAAFAAQVRARGGNPAPHTEAACRILCRRSAAEAAALTDEALAGLPPDGEVPAFEVWRRRIQERLEVYPSHVA